MIAQNPDFERMGLDFPEKGDSRGAAPGFVVFVD